MVGFVVHLLHFLGCINLNNVNETIYSGFAFKCSGPNIRWINCVVIEYSTTLLGLWMMGKKSSGFKLMEFVFCRELQFFLIFLPKPITIKE